MPDNCKITATIEFTHPTRDFGILLRAYDDFEQGYFIRLKTAPQTLCFETLFGMFPRTGNVPAHDRTGAPAGNGARKAHRN